MKYLLMGINLLPSFFIMAWLNKVERYVSFMEHLYNFIPFSFVCWMIYLGYLIGVKEKKERNLQSMFIGIWIMVYLLIKWVFQLYSPYLYSVMIGAMIISIGTLIIYIKTYIKKNA